MIKVDTLAHYGVKGMRWGVRTKRSAAQETRAEIRGLSDKELSRQIDRLSKEKRLYELKSGGTTNSVLKAQLKKEGSQRVSKIAVSGTTLLLGAAIKKKYGNDPNVGQIAKLFHSGGES